MADRSRKIVSQPFIREWRVATKSRAVDLADLLGIERESYYRLERYPLTLSVAELLKLAESFRIPHQRLWELPPPPGKKPRPSLDAIVKDVPDTQVEGLADMLRLAAGRA